MSKCLLLLLLVALLLALPAAPALARPDATALSAERPRPRWKKHRNGRLYAVVAKKHRKRPKW